MKQQEEASYEKIVDTLDRISIKLESMEDTLDSLLQFIEEFNNEPKTKSEVVYKQDYTKKHDSNIMNKFNDWMLKKDKKNDMSDFEDEDGSGDGE